MREALICGFFSLASVSGAQACPDLAGSYICEDQIGEATVTRWEHKIRQYQIDSQTEFEIEEGSRSIRVRVPFSGVIEEEGQKFPYEAHCTTNALRVLSKGQVTEPGDIIFDKIYKRTHDSTLQILTRLEFRDFQNSSVILCRPQPIN